MSYVPILKGKEGEFAALEELEPTIRQHMTPLIEVPDVPYDFVNERPSKTLDLHVANLAERLRRSWPGGRDVYLHLPWCDNTDENEERLEDGRHVLTRILDDCVARQVRGVPVVTSGSSIGYLEAVGEYLAASRTALCIRLTLQDFDEDRLDAVPINQAVDSLLESCDAQHSEALDLIVDLGEIASDSTIIARAVYGDLPRRDWRRIVIASASFPENLSDITRGSAERLPRHEWALWSRLRARGLVAGATFGDYGISNPTTTELDPRTMRMSASIRYTTPTDWLVLKGMNVREYGFEQYHDLCRQLIDRDDYSGRRFSWGDQFIYECAHRVSGPGNATTWRKVGTNHHLTLVVNSLANQGDA